MEITETKTGALTKCPGFKCGKLRATEEKRRGKICLFPPLDHRSQGHRSETVPGSSLGEDVGFKNNFFL
jgi:hypothetical protein